MMSEAIAIRSVHATYDLTLHRAPRAGDVLRTTARVVGLAHRRIGTLVTVRHETVDVDGRPVSVTDYGSVFRGVGFAGDDVSLISDGATPGAGRQSGASPRSVAAPTVSIDVPAWLAHVYTECARIWNPIHSDVAVARAAGLPDIILHGTATLALAVSRTLAHAGADPRAVRRVRARFTGMVRLPSRLTVRVERGPDGSGFAFDVAGEDGASVLGDGALDLRSAD
jgi:acyl dehydratase